MSDTSVMNEVSAGGFGERGERVRFSGEAPEYPESVCQVCGGDLCLREGELACMVCGADTTDRQKEAEQRSNPAAAEPRTTSEWIAWQRAKDLAEGRKPSEPTPCMFQHVEVNDFAQTKAVKAEAIAKDARQAVDQLQAKIDAQTDVIVRAVESKLEEMVAAAFARAFSGQQGQHQKRHK